MTRREKERHDAFVDGFRAALMTLATAIVEGHGTVPPAEVGRRVYADVDGHAEMAWTGYTSEPSR